MNIIRLKYSVVSAAVCGCMAAGAITGPDVRIASLKEQPVQELQTQMNVMRLPGSNTTLCGAMVHNDLWGIQSPDGGYAYPVTAGMYTIQAKSGGKISEVQKISDFSRMRAGLFMNGVYYVFTAEGAETSFYLSQYATSNWSRRSREEIDYVNFPSDLTYDPVTKKVYGFFYNDETQEYDRFCSFSTSYGEATEIGRGMDRNCFAIAANAQGEIYGIWGYTGWLIKVNPKTGAYEQIGRTGVSPEYINSLTFDDATGKLYWASNDDEGKSALYEVNTSTGAATKLIDFDNNATFAGIYALPYSVPSDAPAEVTDIEITFPSMESLDATVSFTAPLLTVGGQPLVGELDVIVEVEGIEKVVDNVKPGEKRTCALTLVSGGEISGCVTACTTESRGVAVPFSAWAGEDIPGAPEDLVLSESGGKPSLSWKAPLKGIHGGAYDSASLRYRIVRQTDNVEVISGLSATSWKDDAFTGTASVSYAVYAYTGKGESEPAVSEKVVFGDGFTIPFTEGFDSTDAFELWTVVDLNGNSTWRYDSSKKYIFSKYDDVGPADDWIFSPRFQLKKGQSYQVELDASTLYDSKPTYAENFEIWLSSSSSPSGKVMKIARNENFLSKDPQRKKSIFIAPADGWYHLGIYTDSPVTHWQLNIDNISLFEVDSRVPGPVTDLEVKPAPDGQLSAIISFSMPSTDTEGRPLDGPLSALVFHDNSETYADSLINLSPGQTVTWTDTPSENGLRTYRVAAVAPAGRGEERSFTTYVGADAPGAPRNLTAVQDAVGDVLLTWDAPLSGADGGWFDSSAVSYRIVRSDGEVLASDWRECRFTDKTLRLSSQALMYYLVTPYIGDRKGTYANTEYDLFGPAYRAPLAETFPDAGMQWYPWISESDGPVHVWCLETSGVNPSTPDQNGDKGIAMFVSDEKTKGITGTFSSPKIDVSSLISPEVSFRMYHSKATDPAVNEALEVYFKADGDEWKKLSEQPILRDNGSEGWQRHAFRLPASSGNVRLKLSAKALGGGNIHVDNITFDNMRVSDIEAVRLVAPSRVAVGEPVPVIAGVSNTGNTDMTSVSLVIMAGDRTLASSSVPVLAAGASCDVEMETVFPVTGTHTVTLVVASEADTDPSNDRVSVKVESVEPVLPPVSGLSGSCTDKTLVRLQWLPVSGHGAVTDDMESYDDWAIDGIGDWVMADMDRDVTCHIKKDLESYPFQNDPKAFQVCNAKKLGINIWPQGTPHSGDKMMMALANINTLNDDWMISPMLNGAEQTVSFYAKAFTSEDVNPERMAVYWSTGSVDPEDFVKISAGEYITVPDSWNEYSFKLPSGARRFAIRCLSEDAFALFIDDVCFNDLTVPAVVTERYEVYRDGVMIGETSSEFYEDNVGGISALSARYRVRAIYGDDRYADSEEVTVPISGSDVKDVSVGSVCVYSAKSEIVVDGAEGCRVEIMCVDGQSIADIKSASRTEHFSVSPGTYIVLVGHDAIKVLVP